MKTSAPFRSSGYGSGANASVADGRGSSDAGRRAVAAPTSSRSDLGAPLRAGRGSSSRRTFSRSTRSSCADWYRRSGFFSRASSSELALGGGAPATAGGSPSVLSVVVAIGPLRGSAGLASLLVRVG